jgi:hypothetical protein
MALDDMRRPSKPSRDDANRDANPGVVWRFSADMTKV